MNRLLLIGVLALLPCALVACSSDGSGAPGSGTVTLPPPVKTTDPLQPSSIIGVIENWSPAGAASVIAESPDSSGPAQVLSTAAVGSDGTFRLSLPAAGQVSAFLAPPTTLVPRRFPAGCATSFSSGAGLQLFSLPSLHAYDGKTDRGLVYPWSIDGTPEVSPTVILAKLYETGKLYLYAADGGLLSGSVKCSGSPATVPTEYTATFNATLVRGWNVLNSDLTTISSYPQGANTPTSSTVSYTLTLGRDGPSKWNLYGAVPGL
jgi:hypothetical protein